MSALPPLLAITPGGGAARAVIEHGERLAAAGVDWLLLREPRRTDRELLELASRVRSDLPELRLSISRRADIARLVAAAGVHLPAAGVPVTVARRVLGSGLVGCSTHTVDEVVRAADEGADYVVFGPVYAPLSKPAERPATGLERLARAAEQPIPVYALGGVTIDRLSELAATGAAGAAGISMFAPARLTPELAAMAGELFGDR